VSAECATCTGFNERKPAVSTTRSSRNAAARRAAAPLLPAGETGARGRGVGGFAVIDANRADAGIGGAGGKRPCRVPLPHANGTFA